MDDLRRQLAALDADQVKQLLSASGHDALLSSVQAQAQAESHAVADIAERKAHGNALFQQGAYEAAVRVYTECIEAASDQTDATLFSNRAMAFLKLQQYDRVVTDCTSALAITSSIKPYLRRATAYSAVGDASAAVQDLGSALSFEEGNREALRLLEQIARSDKHSRSTRIRAVLLVAFRNGWKTLAVKGNPAPPGLNGHVLFTVPSDPKQRVFLYGGRAVRDQKSSVYVLDDRDYTWDLATTAGTPPTPRAWHTVSPLGANVLSVYGGVSASDEDPRIHLLGATPSPSGYTLMWRDAPPTSQAPLARSGHASVDVTEVDGRRAVILFGGRTKRGVTDELWALTVKDEVVEMNQIEHVEKELVTVWPAPRDGHSMVLWSTATGAKYAIVFGGNGQQTEEKMNDVWRLDVATHEWTELECSGDVPAPRSYHSAHVLNDFMIVIGGRMLDAEDGDVFVLDLVTLEWFRVPVPTGKAMTPHAWHASIYRRLQNEIFLLGGGTFHGPSREAAVLGLAKFDELTQSISHGSMP